MRRLLGILIWIVFITNVHGGSSSITLGPPSVYKQPQNHTVNIGDSVQFYCKIRANPLAHVALKFNPVNRPITVKFPKYGGYPTGGNTIVLLDLIDVQLKDEGRYTCFGENKYGTVQAHGWLKFVKECNCNMFGVAYPEKPCDDDGNCVCRERFGGKKCDRCMEGFYDFDNCFPCECNPWGTVGQSLSCDQDTGECNCLPDRAFFDPVKCDGCPPEQYFNPFTQRCQPCNCYPEGSLNQNCDYSTGKCECKDKFAGNKCGRCEDGYYNREEGCEPCDCVIENTLGFDYRCDSRTGQCNCRNGLTYTDPRTCASCPKDTYYDEFTQQCEDCGCNPYGTDRCNPKGECVCKENFTGLKCDECEDDYYGADFGYCEPCNCNPYGTVNGETQCDRQGNCPCKKDHSRINYKQCDGCPPGKTISFFNPLECDDCNCNPKGSVNEECDLYTGQCKCKPNAYGPTCDDCQPGFYGLNTLGECLPCNCDPYNSMSLQCDPDSGQCPCRPNIIFTDKRTCSGCPLGQYSKIPGTCDPCNCNTNGSLSVQCDSTGQCLCQPTVQGLKCDECKPGYFNFRRGGCDPCNCNGYGVVDGNKICDPVTGQCDCKEGHTKLSPRTCDGCPPNFYVNVNNPLQCFSCDCHPYGAENPGCDLYTGICDCGPNVKGDKCDECEDGFYGLNLVGIQKCIPCECDPEGSVSQFCDMFGQCQCKSGYGTLDPRTCLGCPRGYYYQDGFCIPCGCDPRGSLTDECDKDGNCYCAEFVYSLSPKCDTCETRYWFGDPNTKGCEPCQCDTTGTINQSEECDTSTGQCRCEDDDPFLFFLDPRRCEPCDRYQYNLNGECTDCGCHVSGSTGLQCDFLTGQCPCKEGAFGFPCDECLEGYYDLEQGCIPCHCDTRNTINNDPNCDLFGNCQCKENFIYTDVAKCSTCGEGYYEDQGTCSPCDCHISGSVNSTCDTVTGQCPCLEGVTGRRCNECEGDTYGINSGDGCKPCNCNTNGTVSRSSACDPITGQCKCMDDRTQYQPRTCDGCLNNFLINEYLDPVTRECVPCNCLEVGSRQFNCSTYEGKCECNPGVIGDKCDKISEAQDDVVEEGSIAEISCKMLFEEKADRSIWIGDGCRSGRCGDFVVEGKDFMSLSLRAFQDKIFTCRFVADGEKLDRTPIIDTIRLEVPSVTIQRGYFASLVAMISGLNERPTNVIWSLDNRNCSTSSCNLDNHSVEQALTTDNSDGSYIAKSTIKTGRIYEETEYRVTLLYKNKNFEKIGLIFIYECGCSLIGATSDRCPPDTKQCECKPKYTGKQCNECEEGSHSPSKGCLPCDCDPDNSISPTCDTESGQCECKSGVDYYNILKCKSCPQGTYLKNEICEPCGCEAENTVDSSVDCDDKGQCDCVEGLPYLNKRTCKLCDPGKYVDGDDCKDCRCFSQGSTNGICDQNTGKCDCKDKYTGAKCDKCKPGYYKPESGCLPCNCDPDNSLNLECDEDTGQCACDESKAPFQDPTRCGSCNDYSLLVNGECVQCDLGQIVNDDECYTCPDTQYAWEGKCKDCECSDIGATSNVCDKITGTCPCKPLYEGLLCEDCKDGYYRNGTQCEECDCDAENSVCEVCNKETGKCPCLEGRGPFADPKTCRICPEGSVLTKEEECVPCEKGTYPENNKCVTCSPGTYLDGAKCKDCKCNPKGSDTLICDNRTGECECKENYSGMNCKDCKSSELYQDETGECVPCGCNTRHTVLNMTTCDYDGYCLCEDSTPYIEERTCTPCGEGQVIKNGECEHCPENFYFNNHVCYQCKCNSDGTGRCNPITGECLCLLGFTGPECSDCEDEYYSDKCVPCLCSDGSESKVCNKRSGQCDCQENFRGRTCNQCEDGYYGDECSPCECESTAISPICDKNTGQCPCPGENYQDPRTCKECPDNHRIDNGECIECEAGTVLKDNECQPCPDGTYESFGTCLPCVCSPDGTVSCDKATGGCMCKTVFEGLTCDECKDESYKDGKVCVPCDCDKNNTNSNICDKESGKCPCVDDRFLLEERRCEQCPDDLYLDVDGTCQRCEDGYFVEDNTCRLCDDEFHRRNNECIACRCNPKGSINNICDKITGECFCDEVHHGGNCHVCKDGFYSKLDASECYPCNCEFNNTIGTSSCDGDGQCYCKKGLNYVDSKICKTCPVGRIPRSGECVLCDDGYHYQDGNCALCGCNSEGTTEDVCNKITGKCPCKAGYTGEKCYDCEDEYFSSGDTCVECDCHTPESEHNVCNKDDGQCPCLKNLESYDVTRRCFNCQPRTYYSGGVCKDCKCNIGGSSSASCGKSGKCDCLKNVEGDKCSKCKAEHYGIKGGKGCLPCNCNKLGVERQSIPGVPDKIIDLSCDEVTGQCNCRTYRNKTNTEQVITQNRYRNLKCDGCPSSQYLKNQDNQTCVPCRCNSEGSLLFDCDLYTGQCDCNLNVVGKRCDTRGCKWTSWDYGPCDEKCEYRNRTRTQTVAESGDFSIITKAAKCDKVEVETVDCIRCRNRRSRLKLFDLE